MKFLFLICVILVILSITSGYWIDSNGYPLDQDTDIEEALGVIDTVKRGHFCMRWGMECVQNSNFRFTKCCPGLNCVCNFWKTHCKCRAKLG